MTKITKRGRPAKEPVPPQRQTQKRSITVGVGDSLSYIFEKVVAAGGDPGQATFEHHYGYYDEIDVEIVFSALESEELFQRRVHRYEKALERYNKKKAAHA